MTLTIKRVSVAVAAAILGKSLQFVRCGLISGKLPFRVKGSGNRYSYHISPALFMAYSGCSIDDIQRESDCYRTER